MKTENCYYVKTTLVKGGLCYSGQFAAYAFRGRAYSVFAYHFLEFYHFLVHNNVLGNWKDFFTHHVVHSAGSGCQFFFASHPNCLGGCEQLDTQHFLHVA